MNKFALLGALALTVAACAQRAPDPQPIVQVSPVPQTIATTQVASNDAPASTPVTISGGSGSTCLAVDVFANDGAFIRSGTAGSLSGDVFTVNGVGHDISGINYSVKPC